MKKIGRNDPCPCGSGKKFKKCHQGREDELGLEGLEEEALQEMGERISRLPEVSHGRSREILDSLNIKELTGSSVGVKFVDLKQYAALDLFGSTHYKALEGKTGGVFINIYKTMGVDPKNIYVAISRNIDDSTLIHELAHVLDYLGGSNLVPGTLEPVSLELGVPVEHLEHPDEFGYWLSYLEKEFNVELDADDAIISYLYQKGLLIKGREIKERNSFVLRARSDRILSYLSEHSKEIDGIIRERQGYVGVAKAQD